MLLLLDLSAAFYDLYHVILFKRLTEEVGIQERHLTGVSCRLHLTHFECGVLSGPAQLIAGVPQGSVLRPLFFLVYLLPPCRLIKAFWKDRHGYADVMSLYDYFKPKDLNNIVQTMKKFETVQPG